MIQASHVGKVVVAADKAGEPAVAIRTLAYPAVAITGGSGGLALLVSQWLVQRHGPLFLNLLSRSGRGDARALGELSATTACVTSTMADAGCPADLDAALCAPPGAGRSPQLSALLHASGVLQDGLLERQSATSLRLVFAPKLGALATLDAALQRLAVGTVTLFSSGAPIERRPDRVCFVAQALQHVQRTHHPCCCMWCTPLLTATSAACSTHSCCTSGLSAGRCRPGQLCGSQRGAGHLGACLAAGRLAGVCCAVGRVGILRWERRALCWVLQSSGGPLSACTALH